MFLRKILCYSNWNMFLWTKAYGNGQFRNILGGTSDLPLESSQEQERATWSKKKNSFLGPNLTALNMVIQRRVFNLPKLKKQVYWYLLILIDTYCSIRVPSPWFSVWTHFPQAKRNRQLPPPPVPPTPLMCFILASFPGHVEHDRDAAGAPLWHVSIWSASPA